MLKVSRRLNDAVTVVAEGDTQLDVFKQLASLGEVFGEQCCQKCLAKGKTVEQASNIEFRVRTVIDGKKSYEYPELSCKTCYAKFTFGQSEGGSLFPVRHERKDGEFVKDANGARIMKGTKGWTIFNKQTGKEE